MINSILDTDLYKFSTSFAYFTLYPNAEGTFVFNDRNKEDWRNSKYDIVKEFKQEFSIVARLKLLQEEKEWVNDNIPYIPSTYWEWLSSFQYDISKIKVWLDDNGVFNCECTDKLYKVTLYENVVPLYCELRNKFKMAELGKELPTNTEIENGIKEKISYANRNNIPFAEFGTRRRYSSDIQEVIIKAIKKYSQTCTGTSNVYYAMKYGLKPSGTFPHEWMMFHAAVFGYKRANYLGLEDWIKVYDGALGTALVDTYTTKSFLRTLTRKQALLLQGFRQDSGDEIEVGEAIIKRLEEFGIDPKTKQIIFSNALDLKKANKILQHFKGFVKVGFGIGTNLTCDIPVDGFNAPNVVMKLMKARMSNKDPLEKCIKISDDLGKHMGDEKEFEIATYELNLNED